MYYPFDPEATTVAHFAAALIPQIGEVAAAMGADRRFAARVAAIKLFRQGWRTCTIGEFRIATKVDRPIPYDGDDPGPGGRADIAA